jgi:hypothetical protein
MNVPHRRKYEYKQTGNREGRSFAEVDLPLSADTVLTPGSFYQSALGLKCKCVAVEGDQVKMLLLLDAPGRPIHVAEIVGELDKIRNQNVEIEDHAKCRRLEDIFRHIPTHRNQTSLP